MSYGGGVEKRRSWSREPEKVHRWEQGPNSAVVTILGTNVIVIEVSGSFTAGALEIVKPPLEEMLLASEDVQVFWDGEQLESHDSVVREEFVGLLREHRSNWKAQHVLFRSGLIGMTVGALGLLFRGALKSYRERSAFDEAIEAALAELS